jgi:hypothetical protein
MKWEFSKRHRTHTLEDNDFYKLSDGNCHHLAVICTCKNFWEVHSPQKDGYDLLVKGIRIKHGNKVKDLKDFAEKHLKLSL